MNFLTIREDTRVNFGNSLDMFNAIDVSLQYW